MKKEKLIINCKYSRLKDISSKNVIIDSIVGIIGSYLTANRAFGFICAYTSSGISFYDTVFIQF